MPVTPFNLIGGAYSDEVLPLAAQESINWYPEVVETEGARNVIALKGTPGLQTFATVGVGPIRGMRVMSGELYVVSGHSLYQVDSGGVATELGTVDGSGRVGIADNGSQICIVTGNQGYTYDNTIATFARIDDPDFPGPHTVAYLDGYGIYDATDGRFFISENGDFRTIAAIDFASAESGPDPLMAVFVDHFELWLFGSETTEIWQNTGAADFPFERNQGTVIERGLGARHAVTKADNTVYWLGEDGMVYAAAGYIPQRISTHPIEKDIQDTGFAQAFMWNYRDKGHWFIVLCLPDGKTWVYDAAVKLWHRRKSYGMERWRVNAYARAYDKHIVGDYENGTLWEMRSDVYTEGDQPLVAERKTQYGHNEQRPTFHHAQEIVFETGVGLVTGQGSDPIVELCYSNDGGRNFCNWKPRSLGETGDYGARARWHGLGRFTSRLLHVRIADPVKRNLIASTARYEVGSYT